MKTLEQNRIKLPTIAEAIGKGSKRNGKGKACVACDDTGLNSKGSPCPICEKGKEWTAKLSVGSDVKAKAKTDETTNNGNVEKGSRVVLKDGNLIAYNRKGKSYSIPAKYVSPTGGFITFDNERSTITYCRMEKIGKAKAEREKAKEKYLKLKQVYQSVAAIVFHQLGTNLNVTRLTARQRVKNPKVKSVSISGNTESEVSGIMALANARAIAEENYGK